MKRPLAGLRLGVFVVFLLGILSPVATSGVGAQVLTCDDFNSQRAAQAVLDADPSLEESLDPDGDGIACNEDDAPVDDEETPVDDTGSEDGDAFLADVQDEVDSVVESLDRYAEIDSTFADATDAEKRDLAAELEEIATGWSEYPDVAAEFEAPTGLEDVGDAYLDFADMVGETGDLWLAWWDIPQGDPDEEAAFDDFEASYAATLDEADVVTTAIEDAGGAVSPTDDPTEEPSGDADAYLADVQDNAASWSESADRAVELFELSASEGLNDDEVAEFQEIVTTWTGAPDTAAELEAPAGYEDVQDAYGALADEYAAAADAFNEWLAADEGSTEESDASDLFLDTVDSAQGLADDLNVVIEEAGGSTDPGTDDPTEEPSGDTEAYMADVRENADAWNESIARFTEIVGLGSDATKAEADEAADIVATWIEAPDVAAELVAPEGMEEVQAAYEDYADELASAGAFFTEWLGTENDSPEEEAAFDGFIDAIDQAQTLYDELDTLLSGSQI